MNQREKFCDEIRRLKKARKETDSPFLKRDYDKAIKKMTKELAQYDLFQKEISRRKEKTPC